MANLCTIFEHEYVRVGLRSCAHINSFTVSTTCEGGGWIPTRVSLQVRVDICNENVCEFVNVRVGFFFVGVEILFPACEGGEKSI